MTSTEESNDWPHKILFDIQRNLVPCIQEKESDFSLANERLKNHGNKILRKMLPQLSSETGVMWREAVLADIGSEYGVWSVQLEGMLNLKTQDVTIDDISLIKAINGPLHVLNCAVSLISPVFIVMLEERYEDDTETLGVRCVANPKLISIYRDVVSKVRKVCATLGLLEIRDIGLGMPIGKFSKELEHTLGDMTMIQCLFDEWFVADSLQTLPSI